jgi:hypothetical protein
MGILITTEVWSIVICIVMMTVIMNTHILKAIKTVQDILIFMSTKKQHTHINIILICIIGMNIKPSP